MTFPRILLVKSAVLSMALAFSIEAHSTEASAGKVVQKIVEAADHALGSLSESQLHSALFDFTDEAQRRNWSNLPIGIYERKGVRMGDLNEAQQKAVLGLLEATLSDYGYQQVIDNLNAEETLANPGASGRLKFGKDEMYFSILGKPSTEEPWMWQFGGHHLALNATIAGNRVTLSPSLTGGQPMRYEFKGKEVWLLKEEIRKAFLVLNSLSEEQKKVAVVGSRFAGMNYGPTARDIQPKPEGISASDLNEAQKELLLSLINERIGILNPELAQFPIQQAKENIDRTYFSWLGPVDNGSAATFRIQGPTVLIEYCPQNLGGDPNNHNHAMFRNPVNDYGAAIIDALD